MCVKSRMFQLLQLQKKTYAQPQMSSLQACENDYRQWPTAKKVRLVKQIVREMRAEVINET